MGAKVTTYFIEKKMCLAISLLKSFKSLHFYTGVNLKKYFPMYHKI